MIQLRFILCFGTRARDEGSNLRRGNCSELPSLFGHLDQAIGSRSAAIANGLDNSVCMDIEHQHMSEKAGLQMCHVDQTPHRRE
jgi:hypothetical protein